MPTGHIVLRKRLIDALERGRGRRLTLIHAPAGFGKTTLATQWRDRLLAAGQAVAWMSIEPDDNEPIWLLAHLIEAIRPVRPEAAGVLLELLELHPDDAARYVLPALVNQVDESAQALLIVIDDWHRVTEPRALAVLEFLLDHASPWLQLTVLSRTRTGLPLGRLQVRHQMAEVDAGALRFDPAESEQLMLSINGFRSSDEDIADLLATTEGWVVALRLVSRSLRDEQDITELIKSISDQSDSIESYLTENILDQLSPETLHFLLCTALPDRICADLVSALTGNTHGQALLEQIEAEDLFLRPVDDTRTWFRYHHLFVAFLRRRLNRDRPDQVETLHRQAATWFAAHDLTSEAVDHALAAGAEELAVDIVEDQAMVLLQLSRMATLLALVDKLPASATTERPRLQAALGWTNVLLQRPDQALAAVAHLNRIPSVPGDDQLLETRLLRSCVDVYRDRLTGVAEVTTECFRHADSLRPWLVSAAADMQTMVDLRNFDFTAARALQAWSHPFHERIAGALTGIYGQCIEALAALEQLDVEGAHRILLLAHDWSIRTSGANSYVEQMVSGQIGALLCELGDLAGAEAAVGRAGEIGGIGMTEFLLTSHVTTARIKARRGDPETARRHLARGSAVARELNLMRLSAAVFEEEAQLGLDPTEPLPRAVGPEPWPDWIAGDVDEKILRARIFRALADTSREARLLVPEVHQLLARTEAQHRPLAALRARILLAATLHRAGKTAEARQYLAPAVDTCTRTGLVGPLTDGGAPIAELLHTMTDHQSPRLTDRERALLELLDAGRSNQEIAETLGLSANTVKWYLKTLYRKLDVTRRHECVAVARARKLIP